ncbi:MAG: hypothetical protein FJX55_06410 [Alphaproteobacteria bacterium]|nr:hypothetical protein [Alphaproteobacteria bacterium]
MFTTSKPDARAALPDAPAAKVFGSLMAIRQMAGEPMSCGAVDLRLSRRAAGDVEESSVD